MALSANFVKITQYKLKSSEEIIDLHTLKNRRFYGFFKPFCQCLCKRHQNYNKASKGTGFEFVIKGLMFSVFQLYFKSDRLNQVREDETTTTTTKVFQNPFPTISLREAERPSRAGGNK